MNKIIIVGNLTADPAVATRNIGGNDVKVANFSVAVNEGYGETRKTTYFRVNAWRGLAETIGQYLSKGRKVMVTGPVSLRQYKGTDGKIYTNLEVRADEVEFLDSQKTETNAGIPAEEVGGVGNIEEEVTPEGLPF